VAATTKISMLSAPFRSRFGSNFRLEYYTNDEIERIIVRSANLLHMHIERPALALIAQSSRATPRVANRLLKRVRDYALMHNENVITPAVTASALKMLEVDAQGLEETDRKILLAIATTFAGGPVGLKSIAATVSEEESTIEDVYEPYLMRLGFIARTNKGRVITKAGRDHVGIADSSSLKLDF
jgi:holliday junction DNA helicase RuvB